MENLQKIAMLIDADNTQLAKLELVIQEVNTLGRIVVKRAYGNWKKEALKRWEGEIKRLAIKPEQQFDYVSGKNATDMALVIDAMDLLSSNAFDSFVIVSSDSDFTPLAIRLHESGANIIGVGVLTTPESFRNACDDFLFLENLTDDEPAEVQETADKPEQKSVRKDTEKKQSTKKPKVPKDVHSLLVKAYDTYQDNDGYADVSAAGSYIKRAKPDFDTRTYGYSKLSTLLEAFPTRYEVIRTSGKNNSTYIAYKCI